MPLRRLSTPLLTILLTCLTLTSAAPAQCPPAPTIFVCASVGPCEVALAWSVVVTSTSTIIHRGTSPDFASATPIATVATAGYTDTSAPPNTQLWYWVQSTAAVSPQCPSGLGGVSGSATTLSPASAPNSPQNVSMVPGCQSVELSWDAPASGPVPTHYEILRSFANLLNTASLYTSVPASPGRMSLTTSGIFSYYYWIRPVNGCVPGALSGSVRSFAALVAPLARENPAATTDRCDGILVSWSNLDGLSGATSITVTWTNTTLGSAPQSATIPGNSTSYLLPSATVGDNYSFVIVASNPCGDSPATSPVIGRRSSALSFTTHPASTLVDPGATAQFSAAASADAATTTYQWRRNGIALANGGRFSGVNTPTLTITSVAPEDAALYDVIAANPNCGATGASNAAVLGVTLTCRADFNLSGAVTVQDLFDFLAAYFAGCP